MCKTFEVTPTTISCKPEEMMKKRIRYLKKHNKILEKLTQKRTFPHSVHLERCNICGRGWNLDCVKRIGKWHRSRNSLLCGGCHWLIKHKQKQQQTLSFLTRP